MATVGPIALVVPIMVYVRIARSAAVEKKFVMAGVMGWPVAHSRSPVIHNHWIGQYGLRGAYGLFPVQPNQLEVAVRGLRALGMAG